MPQLQTPSTDKLVPELDQLRATGLGSFDPQLTPFIARLAVDAGYAQAEDVTVHAIREFVRTAIGLLDSDRLDHPTAYLYGVAEDIDLGATQSERTTRAAHRLGIKVRAYNDRRPKDVLAVANNLIAVHDGVLERRRAQNQRRDEMPPTPTVSLADPPQELVATMDGVSALDWLDRRQEASALLWTKLLTERDEQVKHIGELSPKLCLFVSGSYGRDEAMEFSDVDMFLIDDVPGNNTKKYGRLNKFERGAAWTLIDRARANRGIQSFSQGGYYQETQSFRRMLPDHQALASEPDLRTTTLALLLANSKCFFNDELYHELRALALDDYWRDHSGNRKPLRPTYLINDLRRLWLTMLVDFERFYPKDIVDGLRVVGRRRKIAGLKLAMPQKLGCYAPILCLLERSTNDGLRRLEAEEVLNMTTRQRLDSLVESKDATIAGAATSLRELYGQYLAFSWCNKEDMEDRVTGDGWPLISNYFYQVNGLILRMLWEYQAKIPDVARLVLV